MNDGCIWLAACHKTQKVEMYKVKVLTVIGRGEKTLTHSGVGVCNFIPDRNHSANVLSVCLLVCVSGSTFLPPIVTQATLFGCVTATKLPP